MAYPLKLVVFFLIGHLLANAVGIPERPCGQLVQDTKLGEDVEVQELEGHLVMPKRVLMVRRLSIVLAARVLIEVLGPA